MWLHSIYLYRYLSSIGLSDPLSNKFVLRLLWNSHPASSFPLPPVHIALLHHIKESDNKTERDGTT